MREYTMTILDDVAFTEKSRIKVINLVCGISSVLALFSAYIGRDSLPYAISLVVLSAIFILALLLNLNRRSTLAKYFVPLATTIWITYMCIAFGYRLGTQNYLVIALVALAIYATNKTYRAISILVIILTAISVNLYQVYNPPVYPLPELTGLLSVINVLTPLVIISMICWNVIADAARSYSIISRQKRDLADSNQFKDKVLSILGHDMRTPFNSAKSLLYLLENKSLSAEEHKQVMSQLHADIDLSLQTLDNILDWASQAYYGSVLKTKTQTHLIMIKAMVDTTIAGFSHLATQKQISLLSEIKHGTTLAADPQQLAFVLRNLTSNALKFSHPGQAVTFTSQEKDDMVVISIKDQGLGMEPQQLNSLFKIETRSSLQGTAKEKGSGLGLIFCKEFIENNGGELWIQSELGKGTLASFALPKHLPSTQKKNLPVKTTGKAKAII